MRVAPGVEEPLTMYETAPVSTQYIAISTVHDDPKQCEHVLSQYFVTVTWDVTVTYIYI